MTELNTDLKVDRSKADKLTSDRWLLDDDGMGTKTWFIPGEGETFGIYTEQDVAPIIERNKQLQNSDYFKCKTSEGEYWKVATIPNVFVLKMLDDHGVNVYGDEEHVAKTMELLDTEYHWLKTYDGQIT